MSRAPMEKPTSLTGLPPCAPLMSTCASSSPALAALQQEQLHEGVKAGMCEGNVQGDCTGPTRPAFEHGRQQLSRPHCPAAGLAAGHALLRPSLQLAMPAALPATYSRPWQDLPRTLPPRNARRAAAGMDKKQGRPVEHEAPLRGDQADDLVCSHGQHDSGHDPMQCRLRQPFCAFLFCLQGTAEAQQAMQASQTLHSCAGCLSCHRAGTQLSWTCISKWAYDSSRSRRPDHDKSAHQGKCELREAPVELYQLLGLPHQRETLAVAHIQPPPHALHSTKLSLRAARSVHLQVHLNLMRCILQCILAAAADVRQATGMRAA